AHDRVVGAVHRDGLRLPGGVLEAAVQRPEAVGLITPNWHKALTSDGCARTAPPLGRQEGERAGPAGARARPPPASADEAGVLRGRVAEDPDAVRRRARTVEEEERRSPVTGDPAEPVAAVDRPV